MKLALAISALLLCLALIPRPCQAQATPVGLGGSFGVGHLPMTDWRNFVEDSENSTYDADPVGLYVEIYGRVGLRDQHALSLSVERISKSASDESFDFRVNWDFVAVPINLTYEFSLRGWATGTTPFFGCGLGLYRTELENQVSTIYSSPTEGKRDGWGYGFHGYIGERVSVAQSLAVSATLRGRWADGMYFTDDSNDIDVDLTGIDVTLGMEWLF